MNMPGHQCEEETGRRKAALNKLAHDLNNVLSTIDGASRILAREAKGEKAEIALEKIREAIKRGSGLSKAMVALHTPETQSKKNLEGTQLSFKVAGMAALVVGSTEGRAVLEQAGFDILEAENLDAALLVQEDHIGDIDVLAGDDLDVSGRTLELFSSMREETIAIPYRDKQSFMKNVYAAAEKIVANKQ